MDLLHAMTVFARVAETESFSEAARAMGLSRSAVSKTVRSLEDRLGVRLLNRTTRQLSLTEEGRSYSAWCARIRGDVEEAARSVSRLQSEPRGTLRVNAPMTFATMHLAPALPDFLARHGDLSVDITLDDRYVDLVDEGYDVSIRIGELEDSSLIARKLTRTRRVVCGAPAYFARHGLPRRIADLAHHNCLSYSYLRAGVGDWRLRDGDGLRAVKASGNLSANNGDVIRAALLAGQGVGWQPTFIVGDDIRAGRLLWVLGEHGDDVGIYAVYPHGRHLSAKIRAFVDFLAERLCAAPSWEDIGSPAS